jgi:hypothetical protein
VVDLRLFFYDPTTWIQNKKLGGLEITPGAGMRERAATTQGREGMEGW